MISAALIFTKFHDIMTTISSVFGIIVVLRIIHIIYGSDLTHFKLSGAACIILLGINNLIYYSEYFIESLPLIQKITFVCVLAWIVGLNFELKNKKALQQNL